MEVVVLFMFVIMTVGIVTAIIGRGAGRHQRQVDGEMARVLRELERMNGRLNDLDERLADMTIMIDEVSRPALDERPTTRD